MRVRQEDARKWHARIEVRPLGQEPQRCHNVTRVFSCELLWIIWIDMDCNTLKYVQPTMLGLRCQVKAHLFDALFGH